MSFKTIQLDIEDRGIAQLTLNRPDKHNAINDELIAEMRDAIATLDADASVRGVVLTGAGESFCAGGDLGWMQRNMELTREGRIAESTALADMLAALNLLSKPLIGRINGPAYGGGVGMISVCDIAIGVDTAKFALTEVRLGLIPATISPYVVARMGQRNARRTFLNSTPMNAANVVNMGLLDDVVSADALDDAIEQELARLMKCSPGAVAATKELIRYVATHDAAENRTYTAERLADIWETEEGRAGIEAFFAKKSAPWINE